MSHFLSKIFNKINLLQEKKPSVVRLILILNALAAFMLVWFGYQHPLGNWDIIPYTALARTKIGQTPQNLSMQTYNDIHTYLGNPAFLRLTGRTESENIYEATIFDNPAALVDNLQLYSIKPFYVFLVRITTFFTLNAAAAAVAVSGTCLALLLLIFPLLFRQSILAVVFLWCVVLLGNPPLAVIATCATPDSAALFLSTIAALLAVTKRQIWLVSLVSVLAILARPDTIFIFFPLLGALAWLQRHETRARGLLYSLAAVTTTFIFLNTQALPWATLFRHTFFSPFSATENVTLVEYLGVIERTLPHVATIRTLFFLTAGIGLAIIPWICNRKIAEPQLLATVGVINMITHYLIFPDVGFGFERMYLSSYVFIVSALLLMLQPLSENLINSLPKVQ